MLPSRLRAVAEELLGLRTGGSLNAGLDVCGFRSNENPVVA